MSERSVVVYMVYGIKIDLDVDTLCKIFPSRSISWISKVLDEGHEVAKGVYIQRFSVDIHDIAFKQAYLYTKKSEPLNDSDCKDVTTEPIEMDVSDINCFPAIPKYLKRKKLDVLYHPEIHVVVNSD
jgi:hypothetical protein